MAGEFTEDLVELVLFRLPIDAQARCRCLSKGCRSALLQYHRSSPSVARNPWVFGLYSFRKESRQQHVLKAWNTDGRCFTFTLSFLPQFPSSLPTLPCAAAGPWIFFTSGASYHQGICQANPLNGSFKWLPNPPKPRFQSFQPRPPNMMPWRMLCCHRKSGFDGMPLICDATPLCVAYRGSPDNYVLLDCGPSCCQMYHAGERCWKIITIPPSVAKALPMAAFNSHCMTFFHDDFYMLYEEHRFGIHVAVLSCDMDAPSPSWVLFHKLRPLGCTSSFRMISCRPQIYGDAITLVCHTVSRSATECISLCMLPLDNVRVAKWVQVDFRLPPRDLRSPQGDEGYPDLCCVRQDDLLWFYRRSSSSSKYDKGFQKLHCYCLSSKSWVCKDVSPDDSYVLEPFGLGTFYPSLGFLDM